MSIQHPNPHLSSIEYVSGGQLRTIFLLFGFLKSSKNVADDVFFIRLQRAIWIF